jgi:hypothetical protein
MSHYNVELDIYPTTTKRQTVVCCLYESCSTDYTRSNRLLPCLY